MFDFDAVGTPQDRMDELERFLSFWLGPRKPEYGEPDAALASRPLPYPLRRLYQFAGRWPSRHDVHRRYNANLFCVQDALRDFSRLQLTDDGKLVFIDENQGVWTNATLPDGDDPPVWVEDVLKQYGTDRWGLVTDSLSRFLVSFCLQEALLGSAFSVGDDRLTSEFESTLAATPSSPSCPPAPTPTRHRAIRSTCSTGWCWSAGSTVACSSARTTEGEWSS